eukprot:6203176-Pleurochrysis_carterae.AAC.1
MTLAVGRVKNDADGLRHMLGDGVTTGIAADIAQIATAGVVSFVALVEDSERVVVNHCKPSACFDLAAAPGMHGCRRKSACLCGCAGVARRQSYPGDGKIDAVRTGCSMADWLAAESILCGACTFKSDLMEYTSLEAAGHVPPLGWKFEEHGS